MKYSSIERIIMTFIKNIEDILKSEKVSSEVEEKLEDIIYNGYLELSKIISNDSKNKMNFSEFDKMEMDR